MKLEHIQYKLGAFWSVSTVLQVVLTKEHFKKCDQAIEEKRQQLRCHFGAAEISTANLQEHLPRVPPIIHKYSSNSMSLDLIPGCPWEYSRQFTDINAHLNHYWRPQKTWRTCRQRNEIHKPRGVRPQCWPTDLLCHPALNYKKNRKYSFLKPAPHWGVASPHRNLPFPSSIRLGVLLEQFSLSKSTTASTYSGTKTSCCNAITWNYFTSWCPVS